MYRFFCARLFLVRFSFAPEIAEPNPDSAVYTPDDGTPNAVNSTYLQKKEEEKKSAHSRFRIIVSLRGKASRLGKGNCIYI